MAAGVIIKGWRRLNAWNRRAAGWLDDPPWRNGLAVAAVFAGVFAVARFVRSGDPDWAFTAFEAVLFFGIGCVSAVWRRQARQDRYRPERPVAPGSDIPGHAGDDDGRRWRVGSP